MAKRGSSMKTVKKPKAVQSKPAVRVEWPREGDRLEHPSYTLHIGAIPEATDVEISIDDGEFVPCRESLGLWWYDWSNYPKGEHVAIARSRVGGDLWVISEPRRFSVI